MRLATSGADEKDPNCAQEKHDESVPQVLQPNLVSSCALPVGPRVIPVELAFAQPASSAPGEEVELHRRLQGMRAAA